MSSDLVVTREDALAHFGVKGMRWGVRKDRSTGPKEKRTPEERKALAKKLAIGAGILTVAAGASYAAYTLSKNGSADTSLLKEGTKKLGENAVNKVVEEPTQLIHFSKPSRDAGASSTTLRFIQKGGISSYLSEMTPFEDLRPNTLTRYGKQGEKIAVNLLDPKGRRDAANRPIDHMIAIPKSLTQGIETIEDVREKIWPILEYDYEEMVRQHILKERS